MKTREEIKKWLLENCIDTDGDLDLSGLDFSDFDGDVFLSEIKVKGNLHQSFQEIQGDLCQSFQKIQGNLYQGYQLVQGDLRQDYQEVHGEISKI